MTSFLEHPNYANDIHLLFYKVMDLGQMVLNFERGQNIVELKINTNRTKVLSLTSHRILTICINGQIIEVISQFVYFDSILSADDDIDLDVTRRINSFGSASPVLSEIWESRFLNINIKL